MTEEPHVTRLKKSTTLGDALRELVRNLGMEGKLEEQQEAVDRWPQAVDEVYGNPIASRTRAVYFNGDGGKLVVEVENAALRHTLYYKKQEILKQLDQSLGRPLVREIIFTNTRR